MSTNFAIAPTNEFMNLNKHLFYLLLSQINEVLNQTLGELGISGSYADLVTLISIVSIQWEPENCGIGRRH